MHTPEPQCDDWRPAVAKYPKNGCFAFSTFETKQIQAEFPSIVPESNLDDFAANTSAMSCPCFNPKQPRIPTWQEKASYLQHSGWYGVRVSSSRCCRRIVFEHGNRGCKFEAVETLGFFWPSCLELFEENLCKDSGIFSKLVEMSCWFLELNCQGNVVDVCDSRNAIGTMFPGMHTDRQT